MNQKQFQTLKARWYRKLAKSGFEDIEKADGSLKGAAEHSIEALPGIEPDLLSLARPSRKESSKASKTSKAEYFRLAGLYLYDKKFPSQLDKTVWRLHAEGYTLSEIAANRHVRRSRNAVHNRIVKLRKLFFSEEG